MIVSSGLVIKSSLLLVKASQAFFFFFFGMPLPEDNWDAWLNDDGLKNKSKLNKSKKYLFDELTKAKNDFISFLDSNEKMNEAVNSSSGARLVDQYIHAHVIRIKKIRLMIEFKTYFNTTRNAYGSEYLVAKSCWISNIDGKVIKKFSKVVGQKDIIRKKGKIPSKIQDEVETELEKIMWLEYLKEYSLFKSYKTF
jgi:hypothetical protein